MTAARWSRRRVARPAPRAAVPTRWGRPRAIAGRLLPALLVGVVAACGAGSTSPRPAASIPVLATPGPTDPPAQRTFYLAPDGSDSAAGTISAPWLTLLGASRHLVPGDLLLVRGGTYHDPGGYDWAETASGTEAAPIVVRAFPGEQPVFDGGASAPATGPDSNPQQALIVQNVSFVTFEGLAFTRYDPFDNGIFLVVGSNHIRFVGIHGYGEFSASDSEHFFYISHSSDVVIENCVLDGIGGAAVHIYSSDYKAGSGAVSSRGVTVLASVLTHTGHWGILAGSGLADAQFVGNSISSDQIGIEFDSPTSGVVVANNTIAAPVGILTNLEAYGGYGPAAEVGDCITAAVPFKVGWPGDAWTLAQWQATGRGEGTAVSGCQP